MYKVEYWYWNARGNDNCKSRKQPFGNNLVLDFGNEKKKNYIYFFSILKTYLK